MGAELIYVQIWMRADLVTAWRWSKLLLRQFAELIRHGTR